MYSNHKGRILTIVFHTKMANMNLANSFLATKRHIVRSDQIKGFSFYFYPILQVGVPRQWNLTEYLTTSKDTERRHQFLIVLTYEHDATWPYSVVEVHRRFGGTCWPNLQVGRFRMFVYYTVFYTLMKFRYICVMNPISWSHTFLQLCICYEYKTESSHAPFTMLLCILRNLNNKCSVLNWIESIAVQWTGRNNL
jgi:hypothetical protein